MLAFQADSDDAGTAACATAALARVAKPEALKAICRACGHWNAFVRAQALESLAVWSMAGTEAYQADLTAGDDGCDPCGVLVGHLTDQETFVGRLALEEEIDAVKVVASAWPHEGRPGIHSSAPAGQPTSRTAAPRTVSTVAADWLSKLTAEAIQPENPPTPAQQAEVADRCRQRLAAAEGGPQEGGNPSGPPTDSDASSDTFSETESVD
jgi:hypothetical protein